MPRRTTLALTVAAASAALAVLTWWLAFRSGAGHRADLFLLARVTDIQDTRLYAPAQVIAALCNTGPYAVLCVGVTAAAAAYHGARAAIVTAAVIVVPNAVSQVLKVVTAVDRVQAPHTPALHVAPESWPSGHATAALSLVLCAIAIAPAAQRLAVAIVGLSFAAAVGLAVTGLGWHFPSDVAGGYLIALCGASLAAGLPQRLVRPVRRPGEDEQQIAQAVQVADGPGADRVPAGNGAPLGAPAHGPAHVQLSAGGRPAG